MRRNNKGLEAVTQFHVGMESGFQNGRIILILLVKDIQHFCQDGELPF